MKQMIQLRDDIMLGRTGAVRAALRRALSLALMIMLFINSVPFTHLTSAEETAGDADAPTVIWAEDVDETVSEGEYDLDGGEAELDLTDDGDAGDAGVSDAGAPAAAAVGYRYPLGDGAVFLSQVLSELGCDQTVYDVDFTGAEDLLRVDWDGSDYVVSARACFDEAKLTVATGEGIVCIVLTDGSVAGEGTVQTMPEDVAGEDLPEDVPEEDVPVVDVPVVDVPVVVVSEDVPVVDVPSDDQPQGEEEKDEDNQDEDNQGEDDQPKAPEDNQDEDDQTEGDRPDAAPAVANPAQSFKASAGLVSVTAEAPEGAFPEGTEMVVRRVFNTGTLSDIRETVAEGRGGRGDTARRGYRRNRKSGRGRAGC